MSSLSPKLKALVDQSVSVLGDVIKRELGQRSYQRIERIRRSMAGLRYSDLEEKTRALRRTLSAVKALDQNESRDVARAFTLMLELMNACENAYRSFSIRQKPLQVTVQRPETIIYVLTAHPTEARSPENIQIFHMVQARLVTILERDNVEFTSGDYQEIFHLVSLAWKTPVVRKRKPRVQDEAEHIYSILLRDETLRTLLSFHQVVPVYVRSWVGGDKDGHPGVDEKTFVASLQLSRMMILRFIRSALGEVKRLSDSADLSKRWTKANQGILRSLMSLTRIRTQDSKRVLAFRKRFRLFLKIYKAEVGAFPPRLDELRVLMTMFPALVVPLEFRESSDILMSSPEGEGLAIFRMLKVLRQISEGGDPKWYVRGFIISMAESMDHVLLAAHLSRLALGDYKLPIVPLFEQAKALRRAPEVTSKMLEDRGIARAIDRYWSGYLEIMLGYSDTSKENGVCASRIEVAQAMHGLDGLIRKKRVTPIFFQGSGGSIDRGGGTIEEQTAWWSPGALRNYKVTLQGEIVERSFASPEITGRQLERITIQAGRWKSAKLRLNQSPAVTKFADSVARRYRSKVNSAGFLSVVEKATPYPFLDQLRIGSRPAKRKNLVDVKSLRAIPWILCWTQTRVLFPTWWGVGSAWADLDKSEKVQLKLGLKSEPAFSVFVRALGFTLAKVELAVWSLYLENSDIPIKDAQRLMREFEREFSLTLRFYQEVTGKKGLVDRNWLAESIQLRSPMIHPLNMMQLVAFQRSDPELLRLTVTGIASGMMTTG